MASDTYDLVVMFGLDTNLKDMIRIERVAELEGVENSTTIDCNEICKYNEAK